MRMAKLARMRKSSRLFMVVLAWFLPSIAAAGLSAPATISPAGNITDTAPAFSWSAVDGAATYEFMLTDDTDSVVYFDQSGITAPPFSIAGAVFDQAKAYHWKVRASDASGNASSWSGIESFLIYDPTIIPTPLAPAGYITTSTPNFQWSQVAGAVNYDLWILNEAETQSINILGSLETTSYQGPVNIPFVPYTVYHYRVRSRKANGTASIWSDPNSFMVYSAADTPQLIGPAGQAGLGSIGFSWQPVASAVSYELALLTQDETKTLIDVPTIQTTAYALDPSVAVAAGTVYHWKVRSNFGGGGHSLWADPMSFLVYDPKFVPDSLMPFGYVTNSRPLLEWSQVSTAVSYKVRVLDTVSQTVLLNDSVMGDTRYDLAAHLKLKQNVSYDWLVSAVFADGSTSVWSTVRSFRITQTAWVGSVSGQTMTAAYFPTQAITFNWKALVLSGMTNITYRVVLRAQPATGGYSTAWAGSQSTATSATLPTTVELAPLTDYAWIVQAYGADGSLIGESRKHVFRSAPAVPARFQQQIEALQQAQVQETSAFKDVLAAELKGLKDQQTVNLQTLEAQQKAALAKIKATQVAARQALQAAQATELAAYQAALAAHLERYTQWQTLRLTSLGARQQRALNQLIAQLAREFRALY